MNAEHEAACHKLFQELDFDGNGCITADDLTALKEANACEHKIAELSQILKDGDLDHDGKVTYEEFKTLYITKHNL